jgi:hypothetical protein
MQGKRFDWRWIGLIVIVAILANSSILPWPLIVLTMVGGGGYLIYIGWQVWNRSNTGTPLTGKKKVVYWRGQRIEMDKPPSGPGDKVNIPPWRAIVPALVYLMIGGALVMAGVALVLRHV